MKKFIWCFFWFLIGLVAVSIHCVQILNDFSEWNVFYNYFLLIGSLYLMVRYYIDIKKIIDK